MRWQRKREPGKRPGRNTSGTWIRWTGRRILRMGIRAFAFRWRWRRAMNWCWAWCTTRFLKNCFRRRGEKAHFSTGRECSARRLRRCGAVCCVRDFRTIRGMLIRTFITTGISRCARTGCGATGRRLWIWRTWPPGGLMVEEAGGKITDLDGKPYVLGGKTILATNGLIHAEMEKMAAEIAKKEKMGV